MTGILLIDKPQDFTSHDVIAKLRGMLREKRIGHAGTLDPMATGLLTVFVGRATRAVEFLETADKTYIAHLRPGVTTDTQDITGQVTATSDKPCSRAELEAVLPQFRGEISQIPPMYSAVKVDGQRLYRLARKGVTVERKPRAVTICALDLLGETEGDFVLEITCSKGTYIRTLCHDIGQTLGCGATLSALRRTRVGDFSVDDAHTLCDIEDEHAHRERFLRPVDTIFAAYPQIALDPKQEWRLRNGQAIEHVSNISGNVRVYAENGEFLAFGALDKHRFSMKKSFWMSKG